MILYGVHISSDVDFHLNLPCDVPFRHKISLSNVIPSQFKDLLDRGVSSGKAHGRKVYLLSSKSLDTNIKGQIWCYQINEVVSFYWQSGDTVIYYEKERGADMNVLAFWFVHLLLPFFLSVERIYDFMHAGAVKVDGKAILFIAPSCGGKSTLTNFFISKDHELISDDKVATYSEGGIFTAVGSHPYHRPYRKFEELGFRADRFAAGGNPIHAFYVLDRVEGDAAIELTEIRGFEKFNTMLPNYLFMLPFLKTERLKYLSALLNQVKMFRIKLPWDLERLGEVHAAIRDHIGANG